MTDSAGATTARRVGLSATQREDLALALVLTIAFSVLPRWRVFEQIWARDVAGLKVLPWQWYVSALLVAAALLLAVSTARRSGLHAGSIREHWRGVLLVCGGTLLATAVVYPQLPVRPWGNAPITMWTLSPLAQELFFFGYLYGRLETSFPGHVHQRIPLARALLLTCAFFALWHTPNFFSLPVGYVVFQLFYTGVLALIPGLARQWTGSIYYGIITHVGVNFIAWYAS
ncbi:MAG TPA: CPBP family intramembrane glutamic endopeptidase [Longimicrobiales bacterium]|nr:CPBP family intramembrane glutamic endopeptidase [Longimicrobiales bacterium]